MDPPPWLQAVLQDLRKSWFFRFWIVCWAVVAGFVLTALFLFSEARFGVASSSAVELEVLNVTSITFPRFSLRVSNGSLSVQCAHSGTPLNQLPCLALPSPDQCVALPEGTVALNDLTLPASNREINCLVNVSTPDPSPVVQWSLDTKDMYPFGPDEFAIVTIRPTLDARLVLVKSLRKTRLGNQETWDKTLTYPNPASTSSVFNITTVIGNFQVTSYNQMTWESQNSGWLYCARLGGIMYFTRCLHALLMFLLSLLLVNDSTFLLGHWKAPKVRASQRSSLVASSSITYHSTGNTIANDQL